MSRFPFSMAAPLWLLSGRLGSPPGSGVSRLKSGRIWSTVYL